MELNRMDDDVSLNHKTSLTHCWTSCWTLFFQYFVKYQVSNHIYGSVCSNYTEAFPSTRGAPHTSAAVTPADLCSSLSRTRQRTARLRVCQQLAFISSSGWTHPWNEDQMVKRNDSFITWTIRIKILDDSFIKHLL